MQSLEKHQYYSSTPLFGLTFLLFFFRSPLMTTVFVLPSDGNLCLLFTKSNQHVTEVPTTRTIATAETTVIPISLK